LDYKRDRSVATNSTVFKIDETGQSLMVSNAYN
jgi:hypothetical protein